LGSQAELDTQLEAAERLGYVNAQAAGDLRKEIDRVRQMLLGLRRSLERRFLVSLGATGAVLATAVFLLALAI
jgi:23S rRNA-intervening sequence protein